MRIDAQVSGFDSRLAEVLERNRFDACIDLQNKPSEHPMIAGVVTRPENLGAFQNTRNLRGIAVPDLTRGVLADARRLGLAVLVERLPEPATLDSCPGVRIAVQLRAGLPDYARFRQVHALMIVGPSDKELAFEVLRAFGPERCMFASGWPECSTWKQRLAAFTQSHGPLPQPVREQLLGGTAMAFFGIGQRQS